MDANTPRGLRNNNPLNIRKGADWKGMSDTQTDKSFVQFKSMAYGYRAAFCTLRTYIQKYKLTTIEKIIGRWAPPNENDTRKYIAVVCQRTGLSSKDFITYSDKDAMCDIVAAMSFMENGETANMEDVRAGYALA